MGLQYILRYTYTIIYLKHQQKILITSSLHRIAEMFKREDIGISRKLLSQ